MMIFPDYLFGKIIGAPFVWFAWYPVKTYNDRWVWLRDVGCARVTKKSYLDGPDWSFWCYSVDEQS